MSVEILPKAPTELERRLLFEEHGVPKQPEDCRSLFDDHKQRASILWSGVVGTFVHTVVEEGLSRRPPEEQRHRINERYGLAPSVATRTRNVGLFALHILQPSSQGEIVGLLDKIPRPALKMLLFASSVFVQNDRPEQVITYRDTQCELIKEVRSKGEDPHSPHIDDRASRGLSPLNLFQEYLALATVAGGYVRKAIKPPKGRKATIVVEPRFYMSRETAALKARTSISKKLTEEQESAGEDRPVESALRGYPFFDRELVSDQAKSDIPKTYTGTGIDNELPYVQHGYRFIHQGDTIACPTVRPDLVTFEYEETDHAARHSAEAAAYVMRTAGQLYDLNALRTMLLPAGRGGKHLEIITGLEAMHRAAQAVKDGRLTLRVFDIKVLTHVGSGVCDYESWNRRKYDVAKTVFAVANFFRAVENAIGTGRPKVTTDELLAHTIASVLEVDFDITSSRYISGDLYPPMRHLGIPQGMNKDVPNERDSVSRHDVEPGELRSWHELWEADIDSTLRKKQLIGKR